MTSLPLYDRNAYQRSCNARVSGYDETSLIFDQTVFYPLGGGQAGDSGTILTQTETFRVRDTVWTEDNRIKHILEQPLSPDQQRNIIGTNVELTLDWNRRYRIMQLHTALHVLDKIAPFRCTGAKIEAEKAHLDFDTEGEKLDSAIVDKLNDILQEQHEVQTHSVAQEDLNNTPELAQTIKLAPPVKNGFVRFIQIGSNGDVVDLQPCGGTHVKNTGEIGKIIVLKNKSRGVKNRRLVVGLED